MRNAESANHQDKKFNVSGRPSGQIGFVLKHGVVEHRLGQQLLQFGVLVFQRLQPFGVRHLQAAVLANRNGTRQPICRYGRALR
jgi:hypothetical protein